MLHTARNIAIHLIDTTTREGGCSFWFNGTTYSTGYVVGGFLPSLVLEGDIHTRANVYQAEQFVHAAHNEPEVGGVGAWTDSDTGKTYVDAVQLVPELAYAMKLADERNEIAIYDLAHDKEIRVEEYYNG